MPRDDKHGPGSIEEASPAPSSPGKGLASGVWDRLGLVLAWTVLLIGVILWNLKPGAEEPAPTPEDVPNGRLVDSQIEMTGRMSLGLSQWMPGGPVETQMLPLSQGSPAEQISFAIFMAATSSPEEGTEILEDVIERNPGDPVVDRFAPLVLSAFQAAEDGERPSEEIAEQLEERFGWFGQLAVDLGDPERFQLMVQESQRGTGILFLFILVFGLSGLLGLLGLVVLIVLAVSSDFSIRIPMPTRHGVYAETFAAWLLLMLLFQYVMGMIARWIVVKFEPSINPGLIMSSVAFFASLVALVWPVLRGIPWSQVREDIGLKAPRWSDLPTGIASWAMALPFMGIGLGITLTLMFMQQLMMGEASTPSHPAQQAAVGAGAWDLVQVFILASIAAPIVEEIMFRGVFLTQLRAGTRRWPSWLGITVAVGVSSIVFAAIHPQGLIFIPPLAGLAIGFCISRMWRGSLVPAMVAHGFSNGLVMSLNVLLFAS